MNWPLTLNQTPHPRTPLQAVNWPDDALARLRTLHESGVKNVEVVVGKLPSAASYPLGPTSRSLLTTDVDEERKAREEVWGVGRKGGGEKRGNEP